MKRLELVVEKLYEDYILDNFDRIILFIGDEGVGKSTLILEFIWLYELARGNDPTPATVMDAVVFDDRDHFRQKLLSAEQTDPIAVMDAAHVLYKKDTMQPDQKETERSLLDVRLENYVILLGYQDWDDIPTILQRRRASNVFRIPQRGTVLGYNRQQLDEKYTMPSGKREWPDPALRDTFPSLEGTDLWARFEQIDAERKRARLQVDEDESADITPQEVAREIIGNSLEEYVKVNEFQERSYYNKALIRYDYPSLSDQQAEQVREALTRHQDPEQLLQEGTQG